MKRLALVLLVFSAVAMSACSPRDAGRKAILDRCLAGAGDENVCGCQAKAAADKLDQELFDLVVLGAQGEEAEAAARVEELSPELQSRFSVLIPEIRRECESAAEAPAS
jgi:hypothetical protein